MRGGLTRRTVVGSALLALLVGGAFAVLVAAIGEQRRSARLATRSQEVLVVAATLERLVLDLETGQRGFVILREQLVLAPWRSARAAIPQTSRELLATTSGGADAQVRRAGRLVATISAYIREYSMPLVAAARRNEPSVRSAAALQEGKRRVDGIRAQFDRFYTAERALFAARERRADEQAQRALIAATAGLAGSTLLIVLFQGYLTRAVVLPVRRAAGMARRLASGDLTSRMPERGAGEIGVLERAFNAMAGSLQVSRGEIEALADEQAALRRVATLVARRTPPAELLAAVAEEAGALLRADATMIVKFDADGAATVRARAGRHPGEVAVGSRWTLEPPLALAIVQRTSRPARVDDYSDVKGPFGDIVRRMGISSSVACPIVVEGRLWGALGLGREREPFPVETEERLAQFTDLVATATANAESRAALAASRARIVATADDTRRRIERDLHDGAQQRLVHTVITLKLARRALANGSPDATELVDEALSHAELATNEVRELAHGILPSALHRGGLAAAVDTLLSRVRVPVAVDVTPARLAPSLEATAYFIVAEALTNAAKHAGATKVSVTAAVADGALHLEVRDDGVGGARIEGSTGLVGLVDRAAALGGELHVHSPSGEGTTITATLPLAAEP